MKILYIVALDYRNKAGLYNATLSRLIELKKNNIGFTVFSLLEEDAFIKGICRKLKSSKRNKVDRDKIIDNNITYKNIIFKAGVVASFDKEKLFKKKINYYVNQLEKSVDIESFDIIHAHWMLPQGYVARELSNKYKIPFIVTAHGSDIHTGPFNNFFIKEKTLEVLDSANRVFFVSDNLRKIASDLGSLNDNFCVSYNGIDFNKFKCKKENFNANKKKISIGYIGNLVEVKGIEYIPQIFKILNENLKNCEFKIIGDGLLRESLEAKFKKLRIDINFLGKVSIEDIPRELEKLDFLIVPSKREGLSCSLIEAKRCGVYPVASNVGGIAEVIGSYGSLIDINSNFEEKFALEIINVIKEGFKPLEISESVRKFNIVEVVRYEIEQYKLMINRGM